MYENLIEVLGDIAIKLKKMRVALLVDELENGVVGGKGIATGLEEEIGINFLFH